jgi:hypothetical protein
MKKQLAGMAMSALVIFSASVFSQVTVQPGLMVGVGIYGESQTGVSLSSNTGFMGGGLLDISFNNIVSLRPGIEYVARGASMSENGEDSDGVPLNISANLTLNYLAIPIDVKVKIPTASPGFCPYALVGLNTAFLLSANAKETASGDGESVTENTDVGSYFTTIDFGLDLGVGADIPVGNIIPFVEFSYYLGIANVDATAGDPSLTNHGFEIKAGIKFKTY